MYRNALLTTDGSDIAKAAIPHVAQVVDPAGRVTVVEVIDEIGHVLAMTSPSGGFDFGTATEIDAEIAEQIIQTQREAAEKHLAEAKAALGAAGIQNVDTVVLQGLAGDRIVEEALSRKSDVIVMSTHGRSGFRRAVLGSVADHVMRNTEGVPVLLVHPAAS